MTQAATNLQERKSPVAAGLIANENTSDVVDFTAAFDSDKGLALLKTRFEKAGHHVHDGSNHDFIVCRWGMSRHCPDVSALRLFARVVGA